MNTPQSQGDAASSSNCTTEDQIDDLLEMDNSYYLDDEMESSQENQDCWNEMYDLSKMNDSQVNESINVEAAINEGRVILMIDLNWSFYQIFNTYLIIISANIVCIGENRLHQRKSITSANIGDFRGPKIFQTHNL